MAVKFVTPVERQVRIEKMKVMLRTHVGKGAFASVRGPSERVNVGLEDDCMGLMMSSSFRCGKFHESLAQYP